MEVEFNIAEVLKVDQEGFIVFSGRDYLRQTRHNQQEKGLALLGKIINTLGENSAISQKLKQIITTTIKFYNTDQRIYIKVAGNKALGFVKVGQKRLFYHDYVGAIRELNPTSVLDIYVHQSCQRTGIGKEIFQKFLRTQGTTPEKLAYDRPSQKLISFLKKHYHLSSYIPQNNNYVIFDRFFQKESNQKPKTSETHSKYPNKAVLEKTKVVATSVHSKKVQPSINELSYFSPNEIFQISKGPNEVEFWVSLGSGVKNWFQNNCEYLWKLLCEEMNQDLLRVDLLYILVQSQVLSANFLFFGNLIKLRQALNSAFANYSQTSRQQGIRALFLRTSDQNIFSFKVSLFLFVCFQFDEMRICPEMHGCHKIFKYKCKLQLFTYYQSIELLHIKTGAVGLLQLQNVIQISWNGLPRFQQKMVVMGIKGSCPLVRSGLTIETL